jgi:hypothetical protein
MVAAAQLHARAQPPLSSSACGAVHYITESIFVIFNRRKWSEMNQAIRYSEVDALH